MAYGTPYIDPYTGYPPIQQSGRHGFTSPRPSFIGHGSYSSNRVRDRARSPLPSPDRLRRRSDDQLAPGESDPRHMDPRGMDVSGLNPRLMPGSDLEFDLYCAPPDSERRRTGPATYSNATMIRIVSPEFPWIFDISRQDAGTVTTNDVLNMLHQHLQTPLSDSEWVFADEKQKSVLRKAYEARRNDEHVTHLKRIDWLGKNTMFAGLHRVTESNTKGGKIPLPPGRPSIAENFILELSPTPY
ncbi:hypothetical protein SISSUDRAFT_1040055 [Sistotremastrum suecicum HHB10207 ss-3]|uniref:DUF6699 domain-containing protein n=1 Tax=Sistotremastrum suecicum HHB10207 ss-3 TaxID=1314776 RepID=A0A166IBM8_9AGAM|nr:hypothetical protein SISSUDRAFT_1040055 [Sistotremastrum suecicum HHB10207 ss-3]